MSVRKKNIFAKVLFDVDGSCQLPSVGSQIDLTSSRFPLKALPQNHQQEEVKLEQSGLTLNFSNLSNQKQASEEDPAGDPSLSSFGGSSRQPSSNIFSANQSELAKIKTKVEETDAQIQGIESLIEEFDVSKLKARLITQLNGPLNDIADVGEDRLDLTDPDLASRIGEQAVQKKLIAHAERIFFNLKLSHQKEDSRIEFSNPKLAALAEKSPVLSLALQSYKSHLRNIINKDISGLTKRSKKLGAISNVLDADSEEATEHHDQLDRKLNLLQGSERDRLVDPITEDVLCEKDPDFVEIKEEYETVLEKVEMLKGSYVASQAKTGPVLSHEVHSIGSEATSDGSHSHRDNRRSDAFLQSRAKQDKFKLRQQVELKQIKEGSETLFKAVSQATSAFQRRAAAVEGEKQRKREHILNLKRALALQRSTNLRLREDCQEQEEHLDSLKRDITFSKRLLMSTAMKKQDYFARFQELVSHMQDFLERRRTDIAIARREKEVIQERRDLCLKAVVDLQVDRRLLLAQVNFNQKYLLKDFCQSQDLAKGIRMEPHFLIGEAIEEWERGADSFVQNMLEQVPDLPKEKIEEALDQTDSACLALSAETSKKEKVAAGAMLAKAISKVKGHHKHSLEAILARLEIEERSRKLIRELISSVRSRSSNIIKF